MILFSIKHVIEKHLAHFSHMEFTEQPERKKIIEIADKYAVPWYKRFGLVAHKLADIPERWYQEY